MNKVDNMDPMLWDYIKAGMNWIIAPVMGLVVWNYKKQLDRVDEMDKRLDALEKDAEVIKTHLDHILKNIDEVKYGINRLINRGLK